MNNPLEQLEDKFREFIDLTDPERFSVAVADYLLFVKDTAPLNTIARKRQPYRVSALYKELEELIKKQGGVPKVFPYSFWDIEGVRPFVRIFHLSLVEQANQIGLTIRKETVSICGDSGNQRVCVLNDCSPRCCPFKGYNVERFRIIEILFYTESSKTVKEILVLLGKDARNKTHQTNLKQNIQRTNKRFMREAGVAHNLISKGTAKGKNIYSLNREQFYFQEEK